MIRLENINIQMEGRKILEDVSFQVPTGHTKVVLGPSGAGKSSLLKIILGLWKPDSGSVFVDGTVFLLKPPTFSYTPSTRSAFVIRRLLL